MTLTVRTTDTNADERVTTGDQTSVADLNYNGTAGDTTDVRLVQNHVDHWKRNALHGALVRRTNYSETAPDGSVNTIGESQVSWSPSQRYISHTSFVSASPAPSCKIFIVPSDPKEGNVLTQLTSTTPTWPLKYHDYDPSWSPVNDRIVFDRGDSAIIRRNVPWSADTTETLVTSSGNCNPLQGDDIPAVSPDGQWVAFSRCNHFPPGGWSLWKVKIDRTDSLQLTPATGATDFYAHWSPDGQTITFQRNRPTAAQGQPQTNWIYVMKIPATGGDTTAVVAYADSFDAATPAFSPDGLVMLAGRGKRSFTARNVVTQTFDPALPLPVSPQKIIANYTDTTFAEKSDFPILAPRMSPDGTRLAVKSKQVWAVRRNMNLPPQITSVGGVAVQDTASIVNLLAFTGGGATTYDVVSTDPEVGPITCQAAFLQSWMSFNQSLCRLTVAPGPAQSGKVFYVKLYVTTPSGGTDAIIAQLSVDPQLGRSTGAEAAMVTSESKLEGPNPTQGRFVLMAPLLHGTIATISVFDMSGRRVALIKGSPGTQLVWEGKDRSGEIVPAGVYLYRMEAGKLRRDGKIVLFR